MSDGYRWPSWFVAQWSRAALPGAVIILALLPLLATDENRPLILLVTLLPLYMIHQYEEHAHGRFMAFFNRVIGHGYDVLTPRGIFWINIAGVWALFLATFYLARFVALGFALVPIYLTLVNALLHIGPGLRLRGYNPGLGTALVLFVPWGGYLLVSFNGLIADRLLANAIGLVAAIAVHVVVIVFALRRRAALAAAGSPSAPGLAASR